MLAAGDKAPEFTAQDQEGVTHSLSDLRKRGSVVAYFYPADFTPICTAEACAFRDRFEDLNAADVSIVGISPQGAESHRRFAKTYGLPFPLLCDQDKKIIRSFGVDGPLGFGVRRVTFLIGTTGVIEERVVSDLFVGNHLDLIKKILEQRPRP